MAGRRAPVAPTSTASSPPRRRHDLTQPDFLDPPPIALPAQNDARAIIYLEVWHRLITTWKTATSARSLNGPDTATRLRTIAQIKVQVIPDPDPDDDDAVTPTCDNALDFLPGTGRGVR